MKTRYSFTRGIRKRSSGLLLLSILLLGLAGLALSACSGATAPAPEPEPASLAGYVILEEDKLYVDEVEVITTEDPDKMAELGLTAGDMPNGYFIHNPNTEKKLFQLTEETVYTFTDFHLLFVEESDSDRVYTTTNPDHYLQHLEKSFDAPFTGEIPYPFFMEVEGDQVLSVTEIFLFTQ